MPSYSTSRLIPLLYIGDPESPVVTRLREHGFGVIVAEGIGRALHLLTQFQVAAVVDDVPALSGVARLTPLGTPILVLATGSADWGAPHVRIVRRDAPAAAIAEAIRQFGIDSAAA